MRKETELASRNLTYIAGDRRFQTRLHPRL